MLYLKFKYGSSGNRIIGMVVAVGNNFGDKKTQEEYAEDGISCGLYKSSSYEEWYHQKLFKMGELK